MPDLDLYGALDGALELLAAEGLTPFLWGSVVKTALGVALVPAAWAVFGRRR